jgi:hypothetical protein
MTTFSLGGAGKIRPQDDLTATCAADKLQLKRPADRITLASQRVGL